MFQKSRRKIIAVIMLIFIAVLAGSLSVIYLASYHDVYQSNQEKISLYIEQYEINGNPADDLKIPSNDIKIPDNDFNDTSYQLATFYSVALSTEGEVVSVDNDIASTLPDEELISIAKDLADSGKTRGSSGSFDFQVANMEDYTLVVLIDNTLLSDNISTLFRNTLIFGGCMLVVLLILSVFLAKWIVKPLEDGYQKQKQFISDAGHELKTPISVVSANAEMLSHELGENKWLSNIVFENERMAELVNQLLALAKTEHVTPVMEELDFSRIVTGGALPFESVAFEHGLTLVCDVEKDLKIQGNRGQLGQLVSTLVDNAIFHGTPGTDVYISLKKEKRFLHLSVSNVGEEIPASEREQIFDRFYRSDESRTATTNRYGLGLAIAKAITLSHRGKIRVDCADGQTVFSVLLPL